MGSSADADEDILNALKSRQNDKAFNLIVSRYKVRIYTHVRRIVHQHEDADDVVQEVFIKVYRHLNKFQGRSQLYTWLYRIAANESISFLKRKSRMVESQRMIAREQPVESGAHQEINYRDAMELLQQAVRKLPEKQQLIFTMRYFQDLSYAEISDSLHTSIGALKASYHHAVKKIENYVRQNGQ